MPPEKIIAKARKLMAMTSENGANENEAYTAAVRLRELLDKHNLCLASLSKENLTKKVDMQELSYPSAKRKNHSFIELANTVAYGYGSEVIIRASGLEFIGVDASALISKEMFEYLWQALNRIASDKARELKKKGGQIKAYKNSFILAASGELFSRFYRLNQESKTDEAAGSFELVRADVLQEEIGRLYPNLKTYDYNPQSNDIDGHLDGGEAGQNISLNQQVAGESRESLAIEGKQMSIKEINDFFEDESNPHKELRNLILESGLTVYKIAKESTVNRAIIVALEKGDKITITTDTAVKLATFFKLDIDQFSLKCAFDKIQQSKEKAKLSEIQTFEKFLVYYSCNETCSNCDHSFKSYITGKHPEYGDRFVAECPECGEESSVLRKLTQNKRIRSAWVKAKKGR